MRSFSLKILGLIAFLGSSPTHHIIYGAIKLIVRSIIVLYLPILLAVLFASKCSEWINIEEIFNDVNRMIYIEENKNNPRSFSEVSDELKGKRLYINSWIMEHNKIIIGVALKQINNPPNNIPCDKPSSIDNARYICFAHVIPVFKKNHWFFSIFPIDKESLKILKFPISSYAIGDLIIELYSSQEDAAKISQRKRDKIKQLVETSLGESIFLPDSESVVTARRLNGEIQYITYFASFLALVLLAIQYLENILPNILIRQIKTITITKEQIENAGLPFENILKEMRTGNNSKNEESEDSLKNDKKWIKAVHASTITYKTPWYGDSHFENHHQSNSFYVAVSDHIRHKGSFLGAKIDAPVIRFRRVAAHAVENTEDTSIVPSFLEVQKESMLAMNDGKTNIIRFLIWAIPTIGFIGTVIGISQALTGTLSLQSSRDLVASAAQGNVSSLMGMAFDTTLIALICAFIVMFIYHLYLGAEADLITRERDSTEEEVMRTVRIHDKKLDSTEAIASAVLSMQHSLPILNRTVHELRSSIDEYIHNSPLNQGDHKQGKDNSSRLKIILLPLLITTFIVGAYWDVIVSFIVESLLK